MSIPTNKEYQTENNERYYYNNNIVNINNDYNDQAYYRPT